jgi:predicted DNA-binding protein (MmcQ/YjbR family)
MGSERDWLTYCLDKPGAWRDEPWENDVVAKVGDKIFAFFGSHAAGPEQSLGLKCGDREAADLWLDRYPGATRKMSYIGAHGWNTFTLDGTIPDDEIEDLIDASYSMVVAKLPRKKRPSTPDARPE